MVLSDDNEYFLSLARKSYKLSRSLSSSSVSLDFLSSNKFQFQNPFFVLKICSIEYLELNFVLHLNLLAFAC